MITKILFSTIALIAVTQLVACSAKVEGNADGGGGSGPTPAGTEEGFFDPRPSIAGPNLEGKWKSACHVAYDYSSYMYQYTVNGQAVERTESRFTDSQCSNLRKETAYKGRFRFLEASADKTYTVEYAFDEGNGITSFPQEKVLVEGNALYLSHFMVGDGATVFKNQPLYKVTGLMSLSSTSVVVKMRGVYPIAVVDGVEHVVVSKDRSTGEQFESARGFCALMGYTSGHSSMSQACEEGPYAVLDGQGRLVKTYPKDQSIACNLSTIVSLDCY